jgi:hypothetical protein
MFAASKSGRVAAAATDPYFPYVPLLLETTSTNGQQNNTFLDSSTNNFTITRNGTVTQGSVTPYWPNGQWGNYFNGSSDYLTTPSNTAFDFWAGSFTFECWFFPTGNLNNSVLFSTGSATTGANVGFFNNTNVYFNSGGGSQVIGGTAPTLNVWNHIALTKSGSTFAVFLNGTRLGTSTSTGYPTGNQVAYLGANSANNSQFIAGYLSNARLVKGTAVYDPTQTTLTVPTIPLTAITNTSLLTCQSNRFKDNSTNNFAITTAGTPKVQAFQPFSPTASYTDAAYGGSGYFSGSAQYLTAPSTSGALGSGDFTVQAWIYCTGNPYTYSTILSNYSVSGATAFAIFSSFNNSKITLYVGNSTAVVSSANIVFNTWIHVAAVRSSGIVTLYINGVSQGTVSYSGSSSGDGIARIACAGDNPTGTNFQGYISNVAWVIGTAVYTANFTPPTAPVTAITNTSLLLNFTNAGIYDAAVQNNAITVGSAQSSITQYKWSPTSMRFNGTTDWLTTIDKPQLNIGTGDFTIECWVNRSATASGAGNGDSIISKGTNNIILSINVNTSKFEFAQYGVAVLLTSTTVISNSTWYYVAITRSGTTLRMFVNGTQEASTTNSANFTSTTSMFIGADANNTNQRLNGYIQDLRITKGIARYTATFTAPTAAFPTR